MAVKSIQTRRGVEPSTAAWIKPELAALVKDAPDGPDWLHEIKLDGYRMHARLDGGKVQSSRKLCARAIRRTSVPVPIGNTHKILIKRRPMRIRGTTLSCGGSHSLMTIRSSAALRVDAMGSWDYRSVFTEWCHGRRSRPRSCR